MDYIAFTRAWIEKPRDATGEDQIQVTVYQLTQQSWPHQQRHVPWIARRYTDAHQEVTKISIRTSEWITLPLLGSGLTNRDATGRLLFHEQDHLVLMNSIQRQK